jgi:hypothetical protein
MKDLTPHEKRLLNEIDPRSYLVKLGDKFSTIVKSINDLEEAIVNITPNLFKDEDTGKIYKYGLSQKNGFVVFNYQEVE